jgi:hypothetical protein
MRKINITEIRDYALRFARVICDKFFKVNTVINGKQIVELCENRQINLFVIKTIYIKWQEEANHIKSPYFDYTVPEVTQAMTALMNVLSRYISIRREIFEPILANAVSDTLILTISPLDYYTKEFNHLGKQIEVATQIKTIAKYFKIHKKLFDNILTALEAEGNLVRTERAVAIVAAVHSKTELDNKEALLQTFDKIIPLNYNNLFVDDTQLTTNTIEDTSFDISALKFDLNFKEESKPVSPSYTNTSYTKPVVEEKFSPLSNPELAKTIMESSKKESMKQIIPYEKRGAFTNVLFGGSGNTFEEALAGIDQCSNYHDAIMYIRENYFRKYSWDLEKDEVKEFYEMVAEKFD